MLQGVIGLKLPSHVLPQILAIRNASTQLSNRVSDSRNQPEGVAPRCLETIFLVEPPRHFEHGCGVETEPTVQIEYGNYAWVRDTASASLVHHFPEPRSG
jgi:hypothetical protein